MWWNWRSFHLQVRYTQESLKLRADFTSRPPSWSEEEQHYFTDTYTLISPAVFHASFFSPLPAAPQAAPPAPAPAPPAASFVRMALLLSDGFDGAAPLFRKRVLRSSHKESMVRKRVTGRVRTKVISKVRNQVSKDMVIVRFVKERGRRCSDRLCDKVNERV